MNEELRALLAKYLAQRNDTLPDAGTPQGSGQEGWNMPQMSLQSRGSGNPAVSGEYGRDGVSLRGEFHRPDPRAPVNWGATLGYRRQF